MVRRGSLFAALIAASVIGLAAVAPVRADAAEPREAALSPSSPTVTWTGEVSAGGDYNVCASEAEPWCDELLLTLDGDVAGFVLDLGVISDNGADIDLYVFGPEGELLGESYTPEAEEHVTLDPVVAGTYRVVTHGYMAPAGTTYVGTADLRARPAPPPTGGGPGTVLWDHRGDEVQASVVVPLRVVAVGFEPGALDAAKVFQEIPDWQQPGVLVKHEFDQEYGDACGANAGLAYWNHLRCFYRDAKPPLLPIEMRWKPELHYAPSSFASGLFDAMEATATTGQVTNADYLARYNATRGHYRVAGGGEAVAPDSDVVWYDAERVEDWIAANAHAHLGIDANKTVGVPGYTVFLLNTWDAPEAGGRIPSDKYHYFKISRPDPDTGVESGIDWARLWGGRYRFMMIDLAAAPNAWEAETWDNVNRGVFGSAAFDPPLWEYRANAARPVNVAELQNGFEQAVTPGATWDHEQLHYSIARMVNQATSFRFLHSFLYEPRPGVGRFFLSDNVWQDANTVIRSQLPMLYDQPTALEGLRSLTPYFEFEGDVVYEDLAEDHEHYAEDQAGLDEAKATYNHQAMSTRVMMDYLDSKPTRFLRGGQCATTVPTMQVVVPAHYGWENARVAGIATNRNGVPWGFLSSVNDLFKWGGADEDETLRHVHEPLGRLGTFTYITIHETSHYLGLAHPHDTIGAVRHADGAPRYYDGFAWTYDSTAAPTTYSHNELTYNVLDQENIARGHMAYYLSWTDDALHEGGVAFHRRGLTSTAQIPPQAQVLRRLAIERNAEAERLYSSFRFVDATFAARDAWKAAAAYHDLATEQRIGTTELAKGTKLVQGDEATVCAKGGSALSQPVLVDKIPATGSSTSPFAFAALLGGLLLSAATASRRRR